MKLFGLNASRRHAALLARRLGVELSAHEERDFKDKEFKIRPLESVRGEDILVYHSLCSDEAGSCADKLCRLLFFVGALRDASAARITAVVPYLAFARKDQRTKLHDPITTRYVAQMFEAVGVDAIVTTDVHSVPAFENAFRCEKENIAAAPLLAQHFLVDFVNAPKIVVLSPDAGGIKRARAFADVLAERLARPVELAFVEKHRSEDLLSGELFAGEVRGAAVVIVDDMICSGETISRAAHAAAARGAASVYAAATHGVFTDVAADTLCHTDLVSIVVTDTAGDVRARCPDLGDKLVVLESAKLLADCLQPLAADNSV